MLPKGTISKILDDFFSRLPIGDGEVQRALDEFFNGNRSAEEINEKQLAIINEWLVFDFRRAGGLTVLEDYCWRNDNQFSEKEKKIYFDLCSTHHYSAFEILRIYRGKGMDIRDVRTGQDFFVQEDLLTRNVEKGNIFLNRVAQVGDHWELVGADPVVLPIAKSTKRWQEITFGGTGPITPRVAFSFLTGIDNGADLQSRTIDSQTARENFSKALEKVDLSRHINADTVADWWREKNMKLLDVITIMQYLALDHALDDSFNELIEASFDFHNTLLNEKLGGKTPQEKILKNPDYRPRFHSDVRKIGDDCWYPFLQEAHKAMNGNDFLEALKLWKKVFVAMRKNLVVRPDIFRFFANKAVCHFAGGQRLQGAMMLDIALELNPNYSFALNMKNRFDKGKYGQEADFFEGLAGERMVKKALKLFLEEDPAIKYYYFVKNLGINFATENKTTDKISIVGEKNPERNAPCPCGSGKKIRGVMGRRSNKSMIGLKRGTVKLVRYNPKWRQSFRHEQKKLNEVFGRDALEIQHVGSTAIPGILAKPIIDIALIAPSLQKAKRYKKKLKEIGYEIKKNDIRKERLFFTKGPEEKRTHYLHVGEIGSGYAEDMILFRDYLCKHKGIAKKYSGLKESLAKKYQYKREIYTAKKEKLVKKIIKKAKKSLR